MSPVYIEKMLIRNLLEVFNDREAESRRSAILELWYEDGVFIDPEGIHRGHDAIDKVVGELFQRFEAFSFSLAGPARVLRGVGCLPWAHGPTENP